MSDRTSATRATSLRPLVIVPTYNERDNLPRIVAALLALDAVRILVVDDRSPDGTGAVADGLAARHPARVSVLHRDGARGLGRSYVAGMQAALAGDADPICQMDADLSHDPGELPRLLDAAQEADLVLGSRYVRGGRIVNWPARRVLLSAFANRYVETLTGVGVRDATSGFRCWRRAALARLPLAEIASNGYSFQVEMTWTARQAGLRIVEVPITFVERRQGASKMSAGVVWESVLLPWRLRWGRGARRALG